jgi:Hemerythrin HHE cation binding domain
MTMHNLSTPRQLDALDLLARDHLVMQQLFKDYEQLLKQPHAQAHKAEVVLQLCLVLDVHTQIEEEIFYPALRAAFGWNGLINHAMRDHEGIKALVVKLRKMQPHDDDYDATVAVLSAYVNPHIKEEQEDLFPTVRKASLNTIALGLRMAERQAELYGLSTNIATTPSTESMAINERFAMF